MNSDQRAEFERRIIQRAFEAGIEGCGLDAALCDILEAMGLDSDPRYLSANIDPVCDELSKPGGPLRSMKDADWLALSAEEWGRRIVLDLYGAPSQPNELRIAAMLRGKGTT